MCVCMCVCVCVCTYIYIHRADIQSLERCCRAWTCKIYLDMCMSIEICIYIYMCVCVCVCVTVCACMAAKVSLCVHVWRQTCGQHSIMVVGSKHPALPLRL